MKTSETSVSDSARLLESFYEDGRRWKWVAPVALAAGGWCLIGLIVFVYLVIPQADAEQREAFQMLPVILGVSGLVIATAGLIIGLHRARRTAPVYLRSFTVLLAVLAGLLGLVIWSLAFVFAPGLTDGSEQVFTYMIALCAVLAVALVALCVLRACRVRAAAVLTPAFALIALPLVPIGTVVGMGWFALARKRETSAV